MPIYTFIAKIMKYTVNTLYFSKSIITLYNIILYEARKCGMSEAVIFVKNVLVDLSTVVHVIIDKSLCGSSNSRVSANKKY